MKSRTGWFRNVDSKLCFCTTFCMVSWGRLQKLCKIMKRTHLEITSCLPTPPPAPWQTVNIVTIFHNFFAKVFEKIPAMASIASPLEANSPLLSPKQIAELLQYASQAPLPSPTNPIRVMTTKVIERSERALYRRE